MNNLRKISSNGRLWTEPRRNIHIESKRRAVAGGANLRTALNQLVNYTLALSNKNFKNEQIRNKVRTFFHKKYFTGHYPVKVVNKRSGKSFNSGVRFPSMRT